MEKSDESKEFIMTAPIQTSPIADFDKVIMRIKFEMMKKREDYITKVKDVEVARALGILETTFRYYKGAKNLPYAEIMKYCYEQKLDANRIFKKTLDK